MPINKYPKLIFAAVFIVAFISFSFIKNAFFDVFADDHLHFSDYSAYLGANDIAVYYSPTCPACTHLNDYLTNKGITYFAKNIDESPAFRSEFEQFNFKTIPLILTQDRAIIGFHKDEVDKAINLYSKPK